MLPFCLARPLPVQDLWPVKIVQFLQQPLIFALDLDQYRLVDEWIACTGSMVKMQKVPRIITLFIFETLH